jgi:hypothetical protein
VHHANGFSPPSLCFARNETFVAACVYRLSALGRFVPHDSALPLTLSPPQSPQHWSFVGYFHYSSQPHCP